ncbi:adhesion G protein-coupled receptor L2-like isoform X1 [Branchiostoma floridae x Branchiostoma japonicum]
MWRTVMVVVLLSSLHRIHANKEKEKYRHRCRANYHKTPVCLNRPDGYFCHCGGGFEWNGRTCIGNAYDSRLEFRQIDPIRYTELFGRAFPQCKEFTITMWLRPYDTAKRRTILSYRVGLKNVFRLEVKRSLRLYMLGEHVETAKGLEEKQWHRVAFTWSSKGGMWSIHWDGKKQSGHDLAIDQTIPSSGELVLGQKKNNKEHDFNRNSTFLGDISHLNIWDHVLNESRLDNIWKDCTFTECGNAASWVDFRAGTRGAMTLRWPSGVYDRCQADSKKSCNEYCSFTIGPQCNADLNNNLMWPRTQAGKTASIVCPGAQDTSWDYPRYANRTCSRTTATDGEWEQPQLSDCIGTTRVDLRTEVKKVLLSNTKVNGSYIPGYAEVLQNLSQEETGNIFDISVDIDNLAMIVKLQQRALKYAMQQAAIGVLPNTSYPQWDDTRRFAQVIADIIDNILRRDKYPAWEYSKPVGGEAVRLISIVRNFARVLSDSMKFHLKQGHLKIRDASVELTFKNFAVSVQVLQRDVSATMTLNGRSRYAKSLFPNGRVDDMTRLAADVRAHLNVSRQEYVGLGQVAYPTVVRLLPNHFRSSKDANINAPMVGTYVLEEQEMNNLTEPLLVTLPLSTYYNVSNPRCLTLQIGDKFHPYRWVTDGCKLVRRQYNTVLCECRKTGIVTVVTDMYDVNWRLSYQRHFEQEPIAVMGCIACMLLCIGAFCAFYYYKCQADTVEVHKNLAASITLLHLFFVIGIKRTESMLVCRGFAVLIHYFFLTMFTWLMNEAFNLYVVVSNAMHETAVQQRPMARYYVMGWVVPGMVVAAFVGINQDSYYDDGNLCWPSSNHVWMLLGPVFGILTITTLVLIFAMKDIVESSYSKDQQANKVVINHAKAVWTQLVLAMVTWTFSFLSLKMVGAILQYLFAIFSTLQGSFFAMFYCVLNEEVSRTYKAQQELWKQKKAQRRRYRHPMMSLKGKSRYRRMKKRGVKFAFQRKPPPTASQQVEEQSGSVRQSALEETQV